ncbi:hypothetical protein LCGC14_0685360 [marine sediment metagenome]|uniref:Uncharacterized protein n=1 Tax=marine sediment metagenome TaxID=412755 RepID=A0A0F9QRW3_9ZZZZ
MPETSFTQVGELQDKTTLKGIYFFLSISISLLIFKSANNEIFGGFKKIKELKEDIILFYICKIKYYTNFFK